MGCGAREPVTLTGRPNIGLEPTARSLTHRAAAQPETLDRQRKRERLGCKIVLSLRVVAARCRISSSTRNGGCNMRVKLIASLIVVATGVLGASWISGLQAQGQNALVGAWERVSLKDAQGAVTQPPGPAAFLILSGDGFFSQTAIPAGRKKADKVDKPVDQMTKEELVERFQRLGARRGTYSVTGNKLTRRNISHVDPNQEGTEATQEFRIEAGMLILTTPGNKAEARFRRAK